MISGLSHLPARRRWLTLVAFFSTVLLVAPRVNAASASANYSIAHHALGGGGGRAQSARYTVHASTAGFGDSSGHVGSGYSNASGFPGQITEEPAPISASYQVALNGSVVVTLTASDPENDPLTFQVVGNPTHGTLAGTPPNLTYQAGPSFATFDQFTFVVHDGTFQSAPATITLVAPGANAPPIMTPIPNASITEGQLLSLQVDASDPDEPTQSLAFSLAPGSPSGAAIDAVSGLFAWTPAESQGPGVYDVTVIARDDAATPLQTTATFRITVSEANQNPTLAAIADISLSVGTLATFTATAVDGDLPAQQLQFSLGSGAPSGAQIDPNTGVFTWTPGASAAGNQFPITITVTDSGAPALSASRAFTIIVSGTPPPPNTAPALAPISDRVIEANSLLPFSATASDSDQPPQQIQFGLGPGAPSGAQIHATSGLFSWTPGSDAAGNPFTITVVATDNGSPPLTASRSFTVTVTAPPPPPPANTAPSLALIADRSIVAGNTISLTALASDGDQPAQQLIFTLGAGAPSGARIDSSTGFFTWTPGPDAAGNAFPVTVIVTDTGSPSLSASRSFMITVNAVPPPLNNAPTLAPIDPLDAKRNQIVTFTATATDSDLPSQRLTFTLDSGAPADAAIDPATGVFSWTVPASQPAGEVSITVRVTDNGSPPLSASQTFKVRVAGPNTPPILSLLVNQSVREGSTLSFLAGAFDRDLPAQKLTYTLEHGAPAGAQFDPDTLTFSWTPTEAQGPGVYPVTLRATDDGDPPLSVTGTFRITVSELNSPPVLTPISDQTVVAGQLLGFTAQATDSDLPAQRLTFGLEDAPTGATMDPATGQFTWMPATNHPAGAVTVRVVAQDSGIPTAQAFQVVRIAVERPPDPPGPTTEFTAGLTETDVFLNLRATPNRCYRIDRSRNLIDWEDVGRRLADASGRLEVMDRRDLAAGGWWYRAVEVSCVSVPPITLTGVVEAVSGQLQLKLRGYSRACYVIEVTRDLVTWTTVEELQAGDAGEIDFRAAIESLSHGIYRARIVSCRR